MLIHAIDIDHPPGMGIADAMAPAVEIVYIHAAIVTITAAMMDVRTYLGVAASA
jgi:hypothetical protein